MARTLPWLKTSSKTTTSSLLPPFRPRKRQRLHSPSPSSTPAPPSITPKTRPSHPTIARSPSTSPPPAPPSEEPMRPGLHADDIYIMVEDEFLSVARTYTAHLHHAEYIRLKHLARDRNASTISNISRPVDSITAMRAETKKKKEREERERRVRREVEGVLPKGKVGDGDGDGSEESEFDEGEGQEPPWEGTQLQGFMRKSPRKGEWGLTGLERVKANTRAAAGFERPERRERVESPTPPTKAKGQMKAPLVQAEMLTSESDDDDLDAPPRGPSRAPALFPKAAPARSTNPVFKPDSATNKSALPSPPRRPPKRSFLDLTPLPKPSSTSTATKPPSKPPDRKSNPPTRLETTDECRSSLRRDEILAQRHRLKARKEKEERRQSSAVGMKADEIPIFLV